MVGNRQFAVTEPSSKDVNIVKLGRVSNSARTGGDTITYGSEQIGSAVGSQVSLIAEKHVYGEFRLRNPKPTPLYGTLG